MLLATHHLFSPLYYNICFNAGSILGRRRLLWLEQEAGRRVEARCGHEGLWTLLSNRHRDGVHSHVFLPWVVIGRPWCIGPAVKTSGGRGLARRATTTSVTIAILVVVAATITVIMVFVVVLVLIATSVMVSTIGCTRQLGRWWLGCRGCSVGVEHRRGSRRPGTVHVNLLQ
jgi:hypothetical protein